MIYTLEDVENKIQDCAITLQHYWDACGHVEFNNKDYETIGKEFMRMKQLRDAHSSLSDLSDSDMPF